MTKHRESWLTRLRTANQAFRAAIDPSHLPVERKPGRYALVTCMDPRINPQALGLPAFEADGACESGVRVIRTIGAVADDRSLLVVLHLAGVREIAVVMHSDCGNSLAKRRADHMVRSLRDHLSAEDLARLHGTFGGLDAESLVAFLSAFDDPRRAVAEEIARLRQHPLVPRQTLLHGLVYDLASARLEPVVDGYAAARTSA